MSAAEAGSPVVSRRVLVCVVLRWLELLSQRSAAEVALRLLSRRCGPMPLCDSVHHSVLVAVLLIGAA